MAVVKKMGKVKKVETVKEEAVNEEPAVVEAETEAVTEEPAVVEAETEAVTEEPAVVEAETEAVTAKPRKTLKSAIKTNKKGSVTRDELVKLYAKELKLNGFDVETLKDADTLIRIFEKIVKEEVLKKFNTCQLFGLNINRKKVNGRIYSLPAGRLDTVPEGSTVYVPAHYEMIMNYSEKNYIREDLEKYTPEVIQSENKKFFSK